ALGVEVRSTLAAADRQPGEGVLEDLLETEELDDAEVHRRVEPQATLERAERGVELDAEATVDVDVALVVGPRHAEHQLALRLAEALDDRVLRVLRSRRDDRVEGLKHFVDGLVELGLARVAVEDRAEDALERG